MHRYIYHAPSWKIVYLPSSRSFLIYSYIYLYVFHLFFLAYSVRDKVQCTKYIYIVPYGIE